ncbi:MAG: hypothetical protein ABSA69_06075, partial [Verrucomicrobiota bacterium]
GVFVFIVREASLKCLAFLGPLAIVIVKHLGHCAPTDVFDQCGLLLGCRLPLLSVQPPQNFNGFEILPKLLLWAALAEPVGLGDAVGI